MKLRIIGIVENMSFYVCPCCQVGFFAQTLVMNLKIKQISIKEETKLFPNSGVRELCENNSIEYLGQLPFDQVK
jgi:Mrp family chromosome partitioning ATPase